MKIADRPTHIYQLVEYGTHIPRYVGKRVGSIEFRRDSHVSKALSGGKSDVHDWIRDVFARKGQVHVELLETVPPGVDWEEAEKRWIREYRAMGVPLTNLTKGGQGSTGWVPSAETRKNISAGLKGKMLDVPKTPEHRDKLTAHWERWHATHEHPWVGRQHRQESNDLVSVAKIKWHAEHPDWVSHMKGLNQSDETKEELRIHALKQFESQEAKDEHGRTMREFYKTAEGKDSLKRAKESKKKTIETRQFLKLKDLPGFGSMDVFCAK